MSVLLVVLVMGVMAAACLIAGAIALAAAAGMGAGRPFTRYLLVGLGLLGLALLTSRPLLPALGRLGLGLVAAGMLALVAWSTLRAWRHAHEAPGLLPSARRLSRLGSRLVFVGVALAAAALLVWVGMKLPL